MTTTMELPIATPPARPAAAAAPPPVAPFPIEQIAAWLRLFLAPGQVTELRCLRATDKGGQVHCGWYDYAHLEDLAREAYLSSKDDEWQGVYFVPNPVNPDLLARRPNQAARPAPKTGLTRNKDVARRRWLLVDIDPTRAAGHQDDSASDAEKAAAREVLNAVRAGLAAHGWPAPVVIDSGNGWHLYYALPAAYADPDPENKGVVRALVKLLAACHSDAAATVDGSVFSAGQLMKVPGTVARKGRASVDRPHRTAAVVEVPAGWPHDPTAWTADADPVPRTLAALRARLAAAGVPDPSLEPDRPTEERRPPRRRKQNKDGGGPPSAGAGTTSYGRTALHAEADRLRAADPGARNTTLNLVVGKVYRLVASGHIGADEATAELMDAALEVGLDPAEIRKTYESAARFGMENPRVPADDRPGRGEPDGPPIPGHIVDGGPVPSLVGAPAPAPPGPFLPPVVLPMDTSERAGPAQLRNYRVQGETVVGRRLPDVIPDVIRRGGGWPKLIGGILMLPPKKVGEPPSPVDGVDDLFGWFHEIFPAGVDWSQGGGDKPTGGQLLKYLRRNVPDRYDSYSLTPHHPPIPGVLYAHPPLPDPHPDRHHLRQFCSFFGAATPADEAFIRAAVLTLFWGGEPGKRPGLMITADEAKNKGRGAGKSTVAMKLARLVGGHIYIDPNNKNTDIGKVIVGPDMSELRVVLIDNLKSLHFSHSNIEGTITDTHVSGWALRYGQVRRLNTYTWFITVNQGALSKDLADRFVPVRITRPKYGPRWSRAVDDFIARHRWQVAADAIAELRREPVPLDSYPRFPEWTDAIISKLPEPATLLRCLADRQLDFDVDEEKANEVEEAIVAALRRQGYDPETDKVHLKAPDLFGIIRPFAKSDKINAANREVLGLKVPRLTKPKNHSLTGAVWNDELASQMCDFSVPKTPPRSQKSAGAKAEAALRGMHPPSKGDTSIAIPLP
jgi:hypothetical protein